MPNQVAKQAVYHTQLQKVKIQYHYEQKNLMQTHTKLKHHPNHPILPPHSFSTPTQLSDGTSHLAHLFVDDRQWT